MTTTSTILDRLANAAKAIVGAITPIITALIVEVAADLSDLGTAGIAAAATAVLVYLTPNKPLNETVNDG